jgi:hypothetical protein
VLESWSDVVWCDMYKFFEGVDKVISDQLK